MNRFTRMLLMSGLGLVTSVTSVGGPAQAASSTGQGASRSDSIISSQWRGDRLVGFFRNYKTCIRAGEWGED